MKKNANFFQTQLQLAKNDWNNERLNPAWFKCLLVFTFTFSFVAIVASAFNLI